MKSTILVVHDDAYHCKMLSLILGDAGFRVHAIGEAHAVTPYVAEHAPDLAILDAEPPRLDAFALCDRLCRSFADLAIVFLSARAGLTDKVKGFDAGADAYLARPIEPAELVAQLRAILRRTRHVSRLCLATRVRAGEATLDLGTLAFTGPTGDTATLTPTEMRLLECLMENADRVVPHERLVEWTWGYDCEGESNRAGVCIRRLRTKIEADPERPELIETVRGLGYRFCAPHPPGVRLCRRRTEREAMAGTGD